MIDLGSFLNADKSMIVAPAGYGKTHTIIEILRMYNGPKKILVLTHTHAGIASIREKAKKEHVNPAKYTLDTISSFALYLTNAFLSCKEKMPQPEDAQYFPFAIAMATKLLRAKPIKHSLSCAYSHLIVDEYQDCTLLQHDFIIKLSEILKTHLLGDPLQGIFDFNDTVNMDSIQQMDGFIDNIQKLDNPWRWKNKNELLGNELADIRKKIEQDECVDVSNYKSICFQKANNASEIYDNNSNVYKRLASFIYKNKPVSLLILVPHKHNVHPFAKRFQKQFGIKEINAFDDKWYYEISKAIDANAGKDFSTIMRNLLFDLFPKNIVNDWINDQNQLKKKRNVNDRGGFYKIMCELWSIPEKSNQWLVKVIKAFKQEYYRQCDVEKTNAILKAIQIADTKSIGVYDGMKQDRDIARRVGRKVYGRYVGTTLLTKGLEFDTVVVMNPNEFSNKKHLYVALSRAVRNLIIISTSKNISLNK